MNRQAKKRRARRRAALWGQERVLRILAGGDHTPLKNQPGWCWVVKHNRSQLERCHTHE